MYVRSSLSIFSKLRSLFRRSIHSFDLLVLFLLSSVDRHSGSIPSSCRLCRLVFCQWSSASLLLRLAVSCLAREIFPELVPFSSCRSIDRVVRLIYLLSVVSIFFLSSSTAFNTVWIAG